MCFSNMYFGLQTGYDYSPLFILVKWYHTHKITIYITTTYLHKCSYISRWVTMGSLQSTILGFLLFRFITNFTTRHKIHFAHFTHLENVVLQTAAVATATMPLAGGNHIISSSSLPHLYTYLHSISFHYILQCIIFQHYKTSSSYHTSLPPFCNIIIRFCWDHSCTCIYWTSTQLLAVSTMGNGSCILWCIFCCSSTHTNGKS